MSDAAPLLLIDRLQVAAERDPDGLFAAGLANAEAWAASGAVASWLIAQGFGPGGKSLSATAPDLVVVLGALRAGTLLSADGAALPGGMDVEALKRSSVDAAVAERRLHITAATPAISRAGVRLCHGDIATVDQLL